MLSGARLFWNQLVPQRPNKPCRRLGCNILTRNANGYCEAHQSDAAPWQQSKSSAERGYGSKWRKLREIVLRRDAGICRCPECEKAGRVRIATEVDHIRPKAEGGTDDLSNLRAIAKSCHKAKTQAEAKRARGR